MNRPSDDIVEDDFDRALACWQELMPEVDFRSLTLYSRVERIERLMSDFRANVMSQLGTDPTMMQLVSVLYRAGPTHALTPTRMAEECRLTSGAITQRVKRAERLGLVTRRPSENDSRSVMLVATKTGLDLIDKVAGELTQAENSRIEDLSPDELDQLNNLLRRLLSILDPAAATGTRV